MCTLERAKGTCLACPFSTLISTAYERPSPFSDPEVSHVVDKTSRGETGLKTECAEAVCDLLQQASEKLVLQG